MMPMNEDELLKRDAQRNIGEELLQAVKQMNAGEKGAVHHVNMSEVVTARNKVGLSQANFAKMLGVSVRTLQEWEQGRKEPSGAAKSLLKIAIHRPDVIVDVLKAA